MLSFILNFTERWLGAFPRVVLTFLGVLVCVLVIVALWDRRMRISSAVLAIFIGLGMVFHSVILRTLVSLQVEQRLKFLGVAMGLAVLGMTVEAVRKAALQKRYIFIWCGTGLGLLALSFHSGVLGALTGVAGQPGLMLLSGGCLFLLLLLAFHFSVMISRLEQLYISLQQRLARLESAGDGAIAPESGPESREERPFFSRFSFSSLKGSSLFSAESVSRTIRGTRVGAPLVICIATLAVLLVGLAAPQAMVGDEVTHYYMLVKQAQDISKPNFYADIPMASGGVETRRYPHSFGWHYLGALVYLVTGGFAGVQLYQAVFFLQLLTVAYLLARSRGGVESRSALLYVLTLASLPLCLFFSVTFYQDVPMTAQVVTSLYLLSRRRWFWASCFMALAIGFKVTAVLFFPGFFFLVIFWEVKKGGWRQGAIALLCATLIVLGSTWVLGKAINIYAQSAFYPQEKLEIVATVVKNRMLALVSKTEREPVARIIEKSSAASAQYNRDKSPETVPTIIANHPGDLRIKENYLIYGGLMIWVIIGLSLMGSLPIIRKKIISPGKCEDWWLFGIGSSFLLMTAYLTRTAPDARFFLPGIPFLLLPLAERIVHLPRPKLLITVTAALALLQGGYVLDKAYHLRVVPPGIDAGIEYLKLHPTNPSTIFMYPEGNYRLFPAPHEWYLGYRLRDFWRADNDKRIEMLHRFGIGAIVVKKHLIAPVDEQITNLGVYPSQFVEDLRVDDRFVKKFENDELLIILPPDLAEYK